MDEQNLCGNSKKKAHHKDGLFIMLKPTELSF